MVYLNNNQLADAKDIAKRPEVVRARKSLVMYKKDDDGLALFRISASNHCNDILTRTIARKRLLKKNVEWVKMGHNEPNDSAIGNMIKDFCNAIERESGLEIIL